MDFKTAVIGLGTIGKVHIAVLKDLNAEIAAVCDCDIKKLENFAQYKCYTDYVKMLDETQPNAVHICTPHYLHTEMIIAALERDIHVLCEKPLCIRKEDIPKIVAAQKKSQAQLGVCLQNRYLPQNQFIKEYLQGKKILSATGNLVWRRGEKYYRSATWRGKWATEGGGVLINQALHSLDLMQYFVGMPKSLAATVSNLTLQDVIEVEDTATLICYGEENGFTFSATNGGFGGTSIALELHTEQDVLKTLPNGVMINGEIRSFQPLDKEYGKHCYGSGHGALIRDFYDCIQTGRKFAIDAEEGAKSVKIVLAAYESQGRRLEI
ncbi:MAG: Gfo/Idh/MocA family oxidoreductase [Clostridia bacterium]|nr:Gfo/Idh/MocA family oxidoreductase [Clostridia bacterium]